MIYPNQFLGFNSMLMYRVLSSLIVDSFSSLFSQTFALSLLPSSFASSIRTLFIRSKVWFSTTVSFAYFSVNETLSMENVESSFTSSIINVLVGNWSFTARKSEERKLFCKI